MEPLAIRRVKKRDVEREAFADRMAKARAQAECKMRIRAILRGVRESA